MKKFSLEEKLNIMFEYYKHKSKEDISFAPVGMTDNYNSFENSSKLLYGYSVDWEGYNGHVSIVSDEDYEKIESEEYYHGFIDFDHGANLLSHYNYHYGDGVALGTYVKINGFYVTSSFNKALAYTQCNPDGFAFDRGKEKKSISEDRVLSIKIKPSKTIDFNDMFYSSNFFINGIFEDFSYREKINYIHTGELKDKFGELYDAYKKIENELTADEDKKLFSRFIRDLASNISTLTVLFGYSVLDSSSDRGFLMPDNKIVLDRRQIIVKESEANRFFQNSVHYKNGSYDFHDVENDGGDEKK